MPRIPHTRFPDSTLAFRRDPYRFIASTCIRLGTDVFGTRLLLRRTICLRGRAAAELIVDPKRIERRGAAPRRLRKTLFGEGGVQSLDGEAHRRRKAMLMAIVRPDRVARLVQRTGAELRTAARDWAERGHVCLYDELKTSLTRSVCGWAGVPLDESEIDRRTADLAAMFEGAGSIGPTHWAARRARARSEKWCMRLLARVRSGREHPPEDSALYAIAWYEEPAGTLLDIHTAAVELLNVLRPTVAISVFMVFAALALHDHPEYRGRLADHDDRFAEAFAQEVRRFYPFFPVVAARTACAFEWNGYRFPRHRRVLLDLFGTDRDTREWDDPGEFRPERFLRQPPEPFRPIPQGPGDPHAHHRCPGERIAVELIKLGATFFAAELHYEVPPQDLSLDWRRLPALPYSKFTVAEIAFTTSPVGSYSLMRSVPGTK